MNGHDALDQAEQLMKDMPRVDIATQHALALGFYVRQVVMPAGFLCTTKEHAREHTFHVSRGRCIVKDCEGREQIIEAPYNGVTPAGTRRILFVEEETVWTTFHPLAEAELGAMIDSAAACLIAPRENPGFEYANSLNQQPKTPLDNSSV